MTDREVIVDAHLDMAGNVLAGRDYDLEAAELRTIEGRTDRQAMVTLPELRGGGVAVAFATLYVGTREFDDDRVGATNSLRTRRRAGSWTCTSAGKREDRLPGHRQLGRISRRRSQATWLTTQDIPATVSRVEELGGRRADGYAEGNFVVMLDPEDNEFCWSRRLEADTAGPPVRDSCTVI